jgi:uncharacterized protein DUF402
VVLRDVHDGEIRTARPLSVVEDAGDIVALALQPGAVVRWPRFSDRSVAIKEIVSGEATVEEHTWHTNHVLILLREGDPYSPQLHVQNDAHVRMWYVNLQDPFRRTRLGFDTMDHLLDVFAGADLSWWQWKDEHEVAEAIELGWLTPARADQIRRNGERAIAEIESGDAWWKHWSDWAPDPSGPIPKLPADWDVL